LSDIYRELRDAEAIAYWDLLRGGDRKALAWLYDEYVPVLYNYGRKLGTDTEVIEDHIHDLFVDLWKYHESLTPTTSVKFYLYRSLRRRIVRTIKTSQSVLGQLINDSVEPCLEETIIETERQTERSVSLQSMLKQLPSRQYEAIVLRFFDNLDYPQIAALLDVNEQSARNLVQRGISQLKLVARLHVLYLPVAVAYHFSLILSGTIF
jgi:RNA polymerase sigma factor (sigma-70 family)